MQFHLFHLLSLVHQMILIIGEYFFMCDVKTIDREGANMSDHYYSKQPTSKSKRQTFATRLGSEQYSFTSDAGVFAKDEVDFGTRLLIEEFVTPDVAGDMLDIGCGYGPIGIALGRLNPDRNIRMIDINERAISLAKENVAENNTPNVTVEQSDFLEMEEVPEFAAILTNPPIRAGKDIVHGIFERSAEVLSSKGEFWIVIQRKQGAPSAERKLRTLFETVEVVTREKGYVILRSVKA